MKQKRLLKKKKLLLPLLVLVLGACAFAVWHFTHPTSKVTATTSPNPTTATVNYSGPTAAEKAQADQNKQQIVRQQGATSTDSSSAPKATVVISSYGQDARTGDVKVGAFVQGVFENGGTCTLHLQKSGVTVQSSRQAMENVSNVSCGTFAVPRSQLSAGTWSATVSYLSSTSSGTSQVVNIDVK